MQRNPSTNTWTTQGHQTTLLPFNEGRFFFFLSFQLSHIDFKSWK